VGAELRRCGGDLVLQRHEGDHPADERRAAPRIRTRVPPLGSAAFHRAPAHGPAAISFSVDPGSAIQLVAPPRSVTHGHGAAAVGRHELSASSAGFVAAFVGKRARRTKTMQVQSCRSS
jgi:hypothetical protein